MFYNILKLYKFLLQTNLLGPEGTPKVALFGSGGGSGIKKLLDKVKSGELKMRVEALVSSRPGIGVETHATNFEVQLATIYEKFPPRKVLGFDRGEYSPESLKIIAGYYQKIFKQYGLDYIFLSGWLRYVCGIPFNKVINIHPGPTQEGYGGEKMHGEAVHKKVWQDYVDGKINQTCVTMHYATDIFDDPNATIVQVPVDLSGPFDLGSCHQEHGCRNAKEVGERVNAVEHFIQWKITQLIVSGAISWTGDKKDKVEVNMEQVKKYEFPEGTVFAANLSLQDGIPYKGS
ncbi:MAG: hypothetical protein PHE25_00545 [Candidatus Gracilibacteria bacterium]|nr:hypothetical protein [Candidatus Gracilibacteria bacterium]